MNRTESWFLGAAFVLLSLLIAVLGFRVRQLKELVDELRPKPKVGLWVPPYHATTLDGAPVALGNPQGQFQPFYFFSPTCPVCKQVEPKVAAIQQRIATAHAPVDMYGVSAVPLDMLRGYAAEGRGTYPLIPLEPKKMVSLMEVHSVPTMVVVDKERVIQWANVGPIDDAAEQTLGKVIFAQSIRLTGEH